jgi:hypothetical protein
LPRVSGLPARNIFDASIYAPVWSRPSLGLRVSWLRDDRFVRAEDRYRFTQTLAYRNYFAQHDLDWVRPRGGWLGRALTERLWGPWSLRLEGSYEPEAWQDARLSGSFRARDEKWTARASYQRSFVSDLALWGLGASHDLSWARLLGNFDIRPSLQDWQARLGLELSAEREVGKGRWHLAPEDRTQSSSLVLVTFEDKDGDGRRGLKEPPIAGLRILLNKAEWPEPTSREGSLFLSPLSPYADDRIEVHSMDLLRGGWRSASRAYVVRNAPGVQRRLEIALQKVAELEGYVYRGDASRRQAARFATLRLRRLSLEVLNHAAGPVVAEARADREGYFLFDEVPAGDYEILCEGSELPQITLKVDPAREGYVQLGELDCP